MDMTEKYEYLKAHYAESETFDEYYRRVRYLAPNFPKPVLKQWLFDHFNSTVNNFSWLAFEKLSFREESWETERIINTIRAWNEEAVTSWKKAFYTSPDWRTGRLIPFMYENGTWPVPPLVIDNFNGSIFPKQSAITRWLLVEGHHRLAYLRALYENPEWTTTNQHSLWVITVNGYN